MVKFLILVVGVGLLGSIKGQSYSRSSCNETSENAEALCSLASPRIIDKDAEYVDVERTADINGALWIGYVRGTTSFAYVSCTDNYHIDSTRNTWDIKSDPGYCYSYCKTPFIGMQTTYLGYVACYCIRKLPDKEHRYNSCGYLCESPLGVLCGYRWRVSIYSVQQPDVYPPHMSSDTPEEQSCLAFSTSGFYFWSSCDNEYVVSCKDDKLEEYSEANWADGMQQCLDKNQDPIYPSTSGVNNLQDNVHIWMGIIRSYTISRTANDYMDTATIVQGHITVGEHYTTLHFENTSQSLYALCDEGHINEDCTMETVPLTSTSTTDTTTSTAATTTATKTAITTTAPTTTAEITTTTEAAATTTSETTNNNNGTLPEAQRQTDGPNLVAVYVVIPIALLAVALIIAFFVWRKRRASGKNGEATDYIDPGKGKNTTRNAVSNAAYQDDAVIKPQPNGGLQHDYLVLEPQNDYAYINASEQLETTGAEYDTTGTALAKHNDTDNVYNRLDNHSNDTYNHVNQHGRQEDDTYNHTNQHDSREDDTYNKVNQYDRSKDDTYNHTNQHDLREDETYNHIGTGVVDATYGAASAQSNSKRRHQETDNDYNELNIGDDTYDQSGGTLSHTGHNIDTDDAYDHVNNDSRDQIQAPNSYTNSAQIPKRPPPTPAKGNPKYDYAYTKAGPTGGSNAPATFGVGQLPNAGSYELAKAPMETANYELAKPPGV